MELRVYRDTLTIERIVVCLSRINRARRHRFPPEIISHAVWLYHRFGLSLRDVEDLLAERGITVSGVGDTWYLDEVFVTIRGERHYL